MIKLTTPITKRALYIEPRHITTIADAESGVTIWMVGEDRPFIVTESIEEVLSLLRADRD